MTEDFEALRRLSADLKKAARELTSDDARWLVDEYYTIQDARIRSHAQRRHSEDEAEPHALIAWIGDHMRRYENDIKLALGAFAESYRVGKWLQSIYGIGPVLSAAVLCHLDIRHAPTVGHWWSFAGLDPNRHWISRKEADVIVRDVLKAEDVKAPTLQTVGSVAIQTGQKPDNLLRIATTKPDKTEKELSAKTLSAAVSKRPWNAKLKAVLVYRMGECFVKFQNRADCQYGKLLAFKKAELTAQNEAGKFKDFADRELKERGASMGHTERIKHWREGKLAPGHIHDRARRWTIKLFMAHIHRVMHLDFYGKEPPKPYVLTLPNHTHEIVCDIPFDRFSEGKALKELYGTDQMASTVSQV